MLNKTHRWFLAALSAAVIALVALVASMPSVDYSSVQAAQLLAPTPIAYANSGGTTKVAEFFNRTPIRADTRVCKDLREFKTADVQYVIDEGTVNTVTVKLQFTINGLNYVDGTAFATAAVADATGLGSYPIVGMQTCVFVDVSNANTVTITAIGIAK